MMRRNLGARMVATALVLVLQLVHAPAWARLETASLAGHVLSADSHLPLSGVRVHVSDPRAGTLRSSTPTGPDGAFSVAGIPPSTYEVAVQSDQGLYLVSGPIHLSAGEARRVQVGVRSEQESNLDVDEGKKKKGATWWNNPLTATLIVLGAAVLIGVAVDSASNDSTSTSPSSP